MANTNIEGLYSNSSIPKSKVIQGKSADQMDMNDFMNLLVAQMTNQDMMNPESNTEFIAQMAQFSTLEGMKTVQEYQLSNYAVSYTGKEVTIANVNETTGALDTIKGVVEKVTFYDGQPQVVVNGNSYPLHTIMEVNTPDTAEQTSGSALNLVANYIGKTVTVTDTSDSKNPKDITGTVTSVTLKGGKPYVIVNGKEYAYTSITSVGEIEEEASSGTGNTDTDNDIDTDTDTGIDTDTDTDTGTDTGTGTDVEYDTDDE